MMKNSSASLPLVKESPKVNHINKKPAKKSVLAIKNNPIGLKEALILSYLRHQH